MSYRTRWFEVPGDQYTYRISQATALDTMTSEKQSEQSFDKSDFEYKKSCIKYNAAAWAVPSYWLFTIIFSIIWVSIIGSDFGGFAIALGAITALISSYVGSEIYVYFAVNDLKRKCEVKK